MTKTILLPPELGIIASITAAVDEDGDVNKLHAVQVTEDDVSVTYIATNGVSGIRVKTRKTVQPDIGKYPELEKVIPTTPAVLTIRVSAKRLRDLLLVAQSLNPENDEAIIEWHGQDKPCVIRVDSNGTEMVGLIMPRNKVVES